MTMSERQRRVVVLGSTGSIGTSTLNCIRRFPHLFRVAALAAGSNTGLLSSQIREFRPSGAYLKDPKEAAMLSRSVPDGSRIEWFSGPDGLERLVRETECDIVVNALVGAAGLRPTLAALTTGKRLALANKESLVIGGELIRGIVEQGKGELVPVDSEHSAILQCLSGVRDRSMVESIILTASGGPFRTLDRMAFDTVSPEAALNHPTWAMGKKITIDAATLMNKGFEVIEAHHLFALPYERLRVLIHPQSIIHSMVEFHDGAIIAQLGCPDMELPIQYALAYPERLPLNGKRLSLPEIGSLDFSEPDFSRFPCLRLCIDAGRMGGTAPAVVNASNEIAVAAFLDGTISFSSIPHIVERALERLDLQPATSLEYIEAADGAARRFAAETISRKGTT